ncbi:TIGR01777 family oxidoreductase [Noviherbaspirillum sp. CPCC 100848]|uniref:TIGR01777 family oxidoreductase n=1 Tax=Noviherbaspirillum album TaxID=3080276 RepID=A0ABU6JC89_9BURK|nr:TIGR01777 family oxidoreductase [Noviherbaspirillum sp. CPCC 100848]MEC4721271.1 TIGR01777 family oxidoreductase [Noviherbaspirillum sp. CPCC 100848]
MNASRCAQGPHPSEGELFKKTLGPEWKLLHPDIRRRFDRNPLPGRPLHYTGTTGAFLAQVAAGVGVALSGLRDAAAAFRLKRIEKDMHSVSPISFCDTAQSVLVTGATGFIGQHLVRALLKDGHQLTVLTRRPKQAAWMFDGKVRCIESMADLPASCRVDVIINLAGARILGSRWTDKRKKELRRSRIGVTQSVVDWVAEATHKPALLLSGSAIGYYGIQDIGDQTVLDETAASQPMFMSDLCREWEDAAKAAAAHGVRVECMRFGLVLGRQGALPMMLMPILLGIGGRLGSGRQWLSWIHVEDVLGGIAHLWKHPGMDAAPGGQTSEHIGVSNFTAPECVSQKTFSETAARIWRRPCFLPTPGGPVRLMLGEQADLLLEGQRVFPGRLRREGFEFRYPELAQALQSLK